MHRFASPTQFLRLGATLSPWVAGSGALCLLAGLYFSLFNSPADYQQGDTVRIMYVHVPASWMAMFCYAVMAGASAASLIWGHRVGDMAAKATAPIGAAFTFLALFTGSVWGKPMWGAWWVWDARLTSVLILFFLYLGYMALQNAFDDPVRGTRAASILALVGIVNLPIIKFSVDWWNTLHQPASVLKLEGPTIHSSMLTPLILMTIAYTSFYVWLLLMRVRRDHAASRIRAIRIRQASV